MTYLTVASITQVVSLLMFIAMFIGVLAYALWPANKLVFDETQRQSLDLDPEAIVRQTGKRGIK